MLEVALGSFTSTTVSAQTAATRHHPCRRSWTSQAPPPPARPSIPRPTHTVGSVRTRAPCIAQRTPSTVAVRHIVRDLAAALSAGTGTSASSHRRVYSPNPLTVHSTCERVRAPIRSHTDRTPPSPHLRDPSPHPCAGHCTSAPFLQVPARPQPVRGTQYLRTHSGPLRQHTDRTQPTPAPTVATL